MHICRIDDKNSFGAFILSERFTIQANKIHLIGIIFFYPSGCPN